MQVTFLIKRSHFSPPSLSLTDELTSYFLTQGTRSIVSMLNLLANNSPHLAGGWLTYLATQRRGVEPTTPGGVAGQHTTRRRSAPGSASQLPARLPFRAAHCRRRPPPFSHPPFSHSSLFSFHSPSLLLEVILLELTFEIVVISASYRLTESQHRPIAEPRVDLVDL